jgi:hypothetical protein
MISAFMHLLLAAFTQVTQKQGKFIGVGWFL